MFGYRVEQRDERVLADDDDAYDAMDLKTAVSRRRHALLKIFLKGILVSTYTSTYYVEVRYVVAFGLMTYSIVLVAKPQSINFILIYHRRNYWPRQKAIRQRISLYYTTIDRRKPNLGENMMSSTLWTQ